MNKLKLRKDIKLTSIKRIVIKLGSNSITKTQGGIDLKKIKNIFKDVIKLKQQGFQIVVVCSGAIQTARAMKQFSTNFFPTSQLQALSSIGQPELMMVLKKIFNKENILISQVLMIHEDFKNKKRYLNAKNTFEILLQNDVIPIVNENDVVSFEEITFGDNDQLAAMTAELIDSELLLLITSSDGLFDKNPHGNNNAQKLDYIEFDDKLHKISTKGKTISGKGGMTSKILSMHMATNLGVTTLLGSFEFKSPILRLLTENNKGTVFFPNINSNLNKRKKRLFSLAKKEFNVIIDEGAMNALIKGASLLPKGILKIQGNFKRGDCVFIKYKNQILACGFSEFESKDFIKNKNDLIQSRKVFIHRNNMALK